jgi:hypothetical protein
MIGVGRHRGLKTKRCFSRTFAESSDIAVHIAGSRKHLAPSDLACGTAAETECRCSQAVMLQFDHIAVAHSGPNNAKEPGRDFRAGAKEDCLDRRFSRRCEF